EWSPEARKNLKKLDPQVAREVLDYMDDIATGDPRRFGKPMRHQLRGYWRYRIGNYRATTQHYDDTLVIFAVKVMHRSKIYKDHEQPELPCPACTYCRINIQDNPE